jgi:hypothetical protein
MDRYLSQDSTVVEALCSDTFHVSQVRPKRSHVATQETTCTNLIMELKEDNDQQDYHTPP